MTSDNKYIIPCSLDKTIRIWNPFENRQEIVLQGHLNGVNSVGVTSDNNMLFLVFEASRGQGWNQSTIVQLINPGNFLARFPNKSPIGEKQRTMSKFLQDLSMKYSNIC